MKTARAMTKRHYGRQCYDTARSVLKALPHATMAETSSRRARPALCDLHLWRAPDRRERPALCDPV